MLWLCVLLASWTLSSIDAYALIPSALSPSTFAPSAFSPSALRSSTRSSSLGISALSSSPQRISSLSCTSAHGSSVFRGRVLSQLAPSLKISGIEGLRMVACAQKGPKGSEQAGDSGFKFQNSREYNRLLQQIARTGNVGKITRVLEEMADRGLRRDVFTYNAALNGWSRAGRMDVMYDFLQEMKEESVSPNTVTLNTALKFFVQKGAINEALEVFESLRAQHVLEDVITWNTLIHISARAKDMKTATEILDRMVESGAKPNPATLTTIINGFAKTPDSNSAEEVYNMSKKWYGISETSQALLMPAVVVCSMADCYISDARPEAAIELLNKELGMDRVLQLENAGGTSHLDTTDLNTALKAYRAMQDLTSTLRIAKAFTEMEDLKPDFVTLNILTDTCCLNDRLDLAKLAIDALNPSTDCTQQTSEPESTVCSLARKSGLRKAHVHQYTSMIRALGASKSNVMALDDCFELVEDMLRKGINPDQVLLTNLIDACAVRGEKDVAEQVMGDANLKWGLRPSTMSYNALVKAYRTAGDHSGAAEVLKRMGETKVKPDIVTYNTVLDAQGEGGDDAGMERVLAEMKAQDIYPDTATYNTLIKRCSRTREITKAFELLKEMKEADQEPDDLTFCSLADACGKTGDVARAREMLALIQSGASERVQRMSYIALMQGYSVSRQPEMVLQVAEDAKRNGIELQEGGWCAIMDAFANVADPDRVLEAIDEMEESGMSANKVHWSLLVKAYCNFGDTSTGLGIVRDYIEKPDIVCYNTLVHACIKLQHYGDLVEILRDMELSGVKPDMYTRQAMDKVGQSAAVRQVGKLLSTFDVRFKNRLSNAMVADTRQAERKRSGGKH